MIKKTVLILMFIIAVLTSVFMVVPKEARADENTRIFIMFRSEGRGHEVDWSDKDMQSILTNEQILDELKKRCEGIEFIGKTDPVNVGSAVKVLNQEKNIDGIVVFGPPPDELIKTGLPIITVFRMWQTWMASFQFKEYKGKKVLFECVPMVRDADKSVFSSRMINLSKKIKLIQAIAKMKNLRALVITDKPVLGAYEGGSKEYEKVFLDNLSEVFGTELVTTPIEELFDKIQETDSQKAEEVANTWIDGAYRIKNTNKTQIVESAKLYLAMKELMDKYDCNSVTGEGYGVYQHYKKGVIPSQGLPSSQLATDGVIAPSETLINSLLTQAIIYYFTGRPGFNGDYVLDPFLDIAIIGHCECPFNPYGDERRCDYTIRNLPYHKKNEGGACVQVDLPINETVTVLKISMYDKKIAVFTGKAVSGRKLFEEWDDISCRTKLAIKTDVKALHDNLDWNTFAQHRVVFYGDFREDIKNLATLIGFEVVEEDR
jgi:L-fucose isomerase-like protein